MELHSYQDISEYFNKVENLLLKNESFYNLKLGLVTAINNNTIETTNPLYLVVSENHQTIGCALRSNLDRPLAISKMSKEALEKLVSYLIDQKIILAGIIGEVETVESFKNLWISRQPFNYKLNLHLGVYETKTVVDLDHSTELILGSTEHEKTIFNFVKGFCNECFTNTIHTDENIDKLCKRHIENKSIFLLKNKLGEIISMAANTRGSTNGGTISLVFTPPEYRGQGLGSSVTAKVAKLILKDKQFANLFTDMTNPTSNSIYQKIGFKMIGENIHYDFIALNEKH